MKPAEERRAAIALLVVALVGIVVRLVGGGGPASPGAIGYAPGDAGARPARDSVRQRAEELARPLRRGERINVDSAGLEQLVRLPRIGPALAARILEDRAARGPFGSAEQLGRVPGIGPRTLERLGPHVRFSGRAGSPRRAAAPTRRLAVNRASAEELAALPGIGPIRAAAIVRDRARNGPYRSLDELTRVRGIGAATVERIRSLVSLP